MSKLLNLWQSIRSRLGAHPVKNLDPRNGYDLWAATYSQEDNPVLYLENMALQKLLPTVQRKCVLDVGCGAGRVTKLLLERGASSVLALDFSRHMLSASREHLTNISRVSLAAADAWALPCSDESFDLVTSSLMIGHVENLQPVVSELSRVTRPGGVVLISDFHPFGHMLGWHRSFLKQQNHRIEEIRVRNYLHLHEDYFCAFQHAGLQIEELREPRIDDSVKHYFDYSRKGRENYRRFLGYPVVLMFRLTRK